MNTSAGCWTIFNVKNNLPALPVLLMQNWFMGIAKNNFDKNSLACISSFAIAKLVHEYSAELILTVKIKKCVIILWKDITLFLFLKRNYLLFSSANFCTSSLERPIPSDIWSMGSPIFINFLAASIAFCSAPSSLPNLKASLRWTLISVS